MLCGRRHTLMRAYNMTCCPTGRPSLCLGVGRANLKMYVLCDLAILSCSLSATCYKEATINGSGQQSGDSVRWN
jgi:hypothetical protein